MDNNMMGQSKRCRTDVCLEQQLQVLQRTSDNIHCLDPNPKVQVKNVHQSKHDVTTKNTAYCPRQALKKLATVDKTGLSPTSSKFKYKVQPMQTCHERCA